jgi:hypothetical protein
VAPGHHTATLGRCPAAGGAKRVERGCVGHKADDEAGWSFFAAVITANRLSALLNEDVAWKVRRALPTGRTSDYNAFV